MYQKEIIYMGLFRDDIKERNAGYLKVDKRENTYRLELQVKNIPGAVTGNFPIRLQSETGWQEAALLGVKEGNGKWNGNIDGPVMRAEVILSDTTKIKGESKLAAAGELTEEPRERTAQIIKEPEKLSDGSGQPPAKQERAIEKQEQPIEKQEQPVEKQEQLIEKQERSIEKQEQPAGKQMQPPVKQERPKPITEPVMQAESLGESRKPEHTPLYENKWEQLLITYEQIHPYGDNRIYVKLAPKDFIILRENYQHLVNNSFLLHGFYNYRYLILGKEKDFYLGVPGVYYEREKMVALMFGFEAFECEGGQAEEGKFGYYLRKVEL